MSTRTVPRGSNRDPRLTGIAGALAASDDGRLDSLAVVAGDTLDREDGDRHRP
jgi:hypothetical protein